MQGLFKFKLTPSRVLVFSFAVLIILGTLFLSLPFASKNSKSIRIIDALFTATSAVCVTGLVVKDTGTQFSQFGQFIIIALIQIGGLGIMTFSTFVAMIFGKKISLKERLLIQESFNQFSLAGLVRLIKNVLLLTLVFECLGGLILSIRFLFQYPPSQAFAFGFFHAISAFCNAGFDLFGQVFGPFTSLSGYTNDWTVNVTIGSLFVIGGLGFPVIVELLKYPSTRKLSIHSRLVLSLTLILIIIGAILFFIFEYTNTKTLFGLDWSGKILSSLFQSLTPRTAGFNSLDISQFRVGTLFIMIILMFIGASPSSTGGGIKTSTFGVLLAAVVATINGKEDAEILKRRIPKDLVYKALTIIILALCWVALVTLVMSLVEPFIFIKLFFEVMSAFGTVGLTTGITPLLTDISRILLIATMFIGRVGLFTVMVALSQSLHNSNQATFKYIEDRVLIG